MKNKKISKKKTVKQLSRVDQTRQNDTKQGDECHLQGSGVSPSYNQTQGKQTKTYNDQDSPAGISGVYPRKSDLNNYRSFNVKDKTASPEKPKTLKEKLWKNSKLAEEYPKSWLVIPVKDVCEMLDKEDLE